MATITIAPAEDVSVASSAYILYSDNATGTVKKCPISVLPLTAAEIAALAAKQDTLVSGTNIKTINGSSILGSGNLVVSGGGGTSGRVAVNITTDLTVNAVGDDATDNTAAFAEAMALDPTQYYLYIPGGIYRTHTVDFNPQMNIIGVGMDAWSNAPTYNRGSVLKSIAGEPIFSYTVNDYITQHTGRIEGIQFDGNDVGTIGLDWAGLFNFNVRRCGFRNFTDKALKFRGCLIGTLSDLYFLYNENDIDLGDKTYSNDGNLPPNFIRIVNCSSQWTKKWCINKNGGSTLYVTGSDFEKCGTDGVDSGVLKITGSTEGLGLVFRENYAEQTHGFATINIQAAANNDMKYVIADNQFNSVGTALHDIYVDATGANKQQVTISNTLAKNAGGLTVVGDNFDLITIESKFSATNVDPDGNWTDISNGAITINGVPIGSGGASGFLPIYSDIGFAALGLGSSDRFMYSNSDDGDAPHYWDGSNEWSLDKTAYTPSITALIFDNFNRADNASSLGSSIIPASAWPTPSGTWGIQSNKAYCPSMITSGTVTYYMAQRDAGASDFTLTAVMTLNSSVADSAGGVAFRYQDDNNTLLIQAYALAGTGTGFDVFKRVGGTLTALSGGGHVGGITSGVPFTLEVVTAGNQIDIYLNGTHVVGPLTEATFNTETHCGMVAVSGTGVGGEVTFDSFTVS